MAGTDALLAKEVRVENSSKHVVTIQQFYKDRNVLITGVTGFLGKVLLEKLLRSCNDIGTIYVVIRQKKGKNINERLQDLLSLPVFERLHKERPDARKKVVAIEGDLADAKFELNERDQKLVEETVSVIFHCAATVKFDEQLKYAVNTNIGGTKHIIELAKKINDLKAFIYVSTAFSNCDRSVVEEEYYPPKAPTYFWKDLISAANQMDENVLNALTPSLIGNLPNTYTFTKQIAESMVYDHKDVIPFVIYRPSIVTSAFQEPFPGWVDNVNGPTGLVVGCYTGVLSIAVGDSESRQDLLGVDYVVNGIIAAAWERGQGCNDGKCLVYTSSAGKYALELGFLFDEIFKAADKVPTEKCAWKPKLTFTKHLILYELIFVLSHLLPALLIDIGFKASGSKFRLNNIYRRVYIMGKLLRFFNLRTISFKNEKLLGLFDKLSQEEKEIFNFNIRDTVGREGDIITNIIIGVKTYLLKEDTSKNAVGKLRKRIKYYVWADITMKVFLSLLVLKAFVLFF